MPNFDAALKLVLLSEGGKVNNPHDKGGLTNKGITQKTYAAWRLQNKLPARSVYAIGDSEVTAIYRHQYADPVHFDDLPEGLGYVVFDEAVTSGPVTAAKRLQSLLGVETDGAIGLLTLAAARRQDAKALINRYCDARLTFMRRLSDWAFFGKGWKTRVASVRARALGMAA